MLNWLPSYKIPAIVFSIIAYIFVIQPSKYMPFRVAFMVVALWLIITLKPGHFPI
jgi:hypothetical protein